jgi:hypothetical protein
MSDEQGFDIRMAPVPFLPANANAAGFTVIDNVAYAATSNGCGNAPNGVWAVELTTPEKRVRNWTTNGGSVAGAYGPAFGSDGTIYAATGDGEYTPASYSDSLVALDAKTLQLTGYFTPGKSAFNSSPVVIKAGAHDWIAAANADGKIYLVDSASPGGSDHRTAVAVSPKYATYTGGFAPGALSAWQDGSGTPWILAPVAGTIASTFPVTNGSVTNGAIAAFKVSNDGGKPSLQPAWVSRDMVSPGPATIVNGVVFALASGEFHSNDAGLTAAQRAQRSTPAVLYAFDGATGKELWNSGNTITSFTHAAGISVQSGNVYVVTYDNNLYEFALLNTVD